MANRRKTKIQRAWDQYFYVSRLDCTTLYLYVVKSRRTKKQITKGGWTERSNAINWLKHNWVKELENEVDKILLAE